MNQLDFQFYNFSTKQKEWTNYEATVFCKSDQQVGYYKKALVEGSIIQISADTAFIKEYNGNHSIGLNDCKIQILYMNESAQPAQRTQTPPAQPAYQQQTAPAYNQPNNRVNTPPVTQPAPELPKYDDVEPDNDIPF